MRKPGGKRLEGGQPNKADDGAGDHFDESLPLPVKDLSQTRLNTKDEVFGYWIQEFDSRLRQASVDVVDNTQTGEETDSADDPSNTTGAKARRPLPANYIPKHWADQALDRERQDHYRNVLKGGENQYLVKEYLDSELQAMANEPPLPLLERTKPNLKCDIKVKRMANRMSEVTGHIYDSYRFELSELETEAPANQGEFFHQLGKRLGLQSEAQLATYLTNKLATERNQKSLQQSRNASQARLLLTQLNHRQQSQDQDQNPYQDHESTDDFTLALNALAGDPGAIHASGSFVQARRHVGLSNAGSFRRPRQNTLASQSIKNIQKNRSESNDRLDRKSRSPTRK